MVDQQKEIVLRKLESLNIEYQIVHHPAVCTVEDIDRLDMSSYGDVCKNLFLRDAKGERHLLVVLDEKKTADLKSLQVQLDCTRLGFASEERLHRCLRLRKGEVTPLAVINDLEHVVEVVFDRDLVGRERIGVHPNDNTATVWLSFDALMRFVEQNGNTIHFVSI